MPKPSSLDPLFAPANVAVIGASDKPRSVGRTILRNLIDSPFGGAVYPINPAHAQVLGIKAYPHIADAPEVVDLAVIATPAPTVPELIRECVAANTKCAIVISTGFRESGPAGAELEQQIIEAIRGSALRILGPNSLGLIRPPTGLNASFAVTLPRKGDIAFISQSGALGAAVLDWSIRENFGFSAFVSVGSMLDIGWGEFIDYVGADPQTKSIVIYMESVGDARAFLSAARQVAPDKPIIVLKAGRTVEGARAAERHIGALMESDTILDAAFRRAGALRVETVADLFHSAEVLAKQPRPRGPRLAILTNAGGAGVLATDAHIARGGALAELSDETLAQLDQILPQYWSGANPVDMLGIAGPDEFSRALDLVSHDANVDGVLAILTPQAMTDPTSSAKAIVPFARMRSKPLLASWMGGAEVEIGANILRDASVPVFQYPDQAVRMFDFLWRYDENLRALYETPTPGLPLESGGRERVRALIDAARRTGRTILTEDESRQILTAYDIPFIETRLAKTAAEASKMSDALGYPVVMKINTDRLIRKTEYGGVILNITSANNVRATFRAVKNTVTKLLGAEKFQGVLLQPMLNLQGGYALHIGSILDPRFGPVLRFGAEKRPAPADPRGIPITADATAMLERDARYRDDALALPPLTTTLARRMIEPTRIYSILQEAGLDLSPLDQVLTHFSALVLEQLWIKAIEIHPLMVLPPSREGELPQVLALDARILLHDPALSEKDLPRPAIRPYPSQYISAYTMDDGTPVVIRPIRPDDEVLLADFHKKLSEQSVHLRYFSTLNLSERVAHERLSRIASIDYAREIALVVERENPANGGQTTPAGAPENGAREIIAIARLTRLRGSDQAEFAVLIRDDFQRQGLGTAVVSALIEVARAEGIATLGGQVLPENAGMKRLAEKLGFTLTYEMEEGLTRIEKSLKNETA